MPAAVLKEDPEMSADDIPAELQKRIAQHIEHGTLEKALDNADEGKRLLDAGRKEGQLAAKKKADARRQFILDTARQAKHDYPYLLPGGVIAEVEQALWNNSREYGKLLSPKTIFAILHKAGVFRAAGKPLRESA